MKTEFSKYKNKDIMFSAIFIVVLSLLFCFFLDEMKIILRYMLERKYLYAVVWITIIVIYAYRYKMINKSRDVSQIDIFIDNALGAITAGTLITSALILFRGLFIQIAFGDKQYFTELGVIDVTAIIITVFFLLFYSIRRVLATAKEVYTVRHTEQVLSQGKPAQKPDDSNT